MTREEFFTVLRAAAVKRPFQPLSERAVIRQEGTERCPLCVVATKVFNKKFATRHVFLAATLLDLPDDLWHKVIHFADSPKSTREDDDDVQAELLAACYPAKEG